MPKVTRIPVLASAYRNKRLKNTEGTSRPNFDEGFDIAIKIGELEQKLESEPTERVRSLLKGEIRGLEDIITRGKSQFAAEQNRPLITAALKIIRGDPPADQTKMKSWKKMQVEKVNQMSVADLIRQLEALGATEYINSNGCKMRYTNRHIRKILKAKLHLPNPQIL